jgi:hypothetical protein
MFPTIQIPTVKTGPFRFGQQSPEKRARLWQPNPDANGRPNPQRLALESKADEVFYGGAAGGGKTDLGIGAAILGHRQVAIFRRIFPNLDAIEQRLIALLGDEHYNRSRRVWDNGRLRIELESCQREEHKTKQQGRPRDLYVFDEITEFSRSIYQFITGWNRTTIPGQRTRIICTGNPPIDSDGLWVVEEWAPWLDPHFYEPAKPGELRWYYYDEGGRIQWQRDDSLVEVDGTTIKPTSRTFIPASLVDNPHLATDGRYAQRLNAMPEPLRSAFRDGNFRALTEQGDPFQVIPAAWVRAAQRRWLEREQPAQAPDGAGHDVSRGGQDATTYAERWGDYFGPIYTWPGYSIPDGPTAAIKVHSVAEKKPPALLNVDIIGYGASSYDSLKGMGYSVQPVNVSSGSSYQDKSGKLTMANLRAELYWRMRDALDPDNNSSICLPDDSELLRDLCSARYMPQAGGKIKVESKEDIKKRIGRSPDKGDAVLMANYDGPTTLEAGATSYV